MASSSASSASNNRGRNWTEPDSLILIDAYQFVMSSKERMTFLQLRLTQLAGESASISNDRIASKFLASSPMVTTRSTDSIKERWIKMVATYRYPTHHCFPTNKMHICDWHAGRLVGCTGQPRWFELEKPVQKKSLGKSYMPLTNCAKSDPFIGNIISSNGSSFGQRGHIQSASPGRCKWARAPYFRTAHPVYFKPVDA